MSDYRNLPARPRVGIVGATGLVGGMMRELLAERNFPLASLRLFASARSAGSTIVFEGQEIVVEDAETADFAGLDLVFFSAGGSTSKKLAPVAVAASSTTISRPSKTIFDPAERVEANSRSEASGKLRSASSSRIIPPTRPVAPTMPTLRRAGRVR